MDDAAAGAAYVDAAARDDLRPGVHVAENEHRALALHLLSAAKRAVHDEHLHVLLVCVRLCLHLGRLRLLPAEDGSRPRRCRCRRPDHRADGRLLCISFFLHLTEVQAVLQEELLQSEAFLRRERPRAPLDDRAAPEEQGARFQLFTNLALNNRKLGLSHQHEQKPRLQPLEQYAFFLHDFLAFACVCGDAPHEGSRNGFGAFALSFLLAVIRFYYIKISAAPPLLDEQL